MSEIKINNLSFHYDGSYDNVFSDVTLQIDTDWKLGLVGRNGQGKTTFFRLLQNKLEFSGSIFMPLKCEYFPYDTGSCIYVYEVLEHINPEYEEWQVQKELNLMDFSKLDLYREFSSYSKGEQTKIMLAAMFSKEGSFLLIDEPTNHLDRVGRKVLAQYLNKKSSYIIVSHDKVFLDGCIDHVMSINRSNIEICRGNMTSYLENKQNRDDNETSQNEKIKAEIVYLKEAARRQTEWSDKAEKSKFSGKDEHSGLRPDRGAIGARAAKLMKRATVFKNRIADNIDEKSALLKNVDRCDALTLKGDDAIGGGALVSVKELVIYYDERVINSPLSFTIEQGEKVSLVGKNGSGKSSIIKAILGEIKSYRGEIYLNGRIKTSYVSQDTSLAKGKIEDFCEENDVELTKLLTMLNKLGFKKEQFDKKIENFSEGQKKKLLIAKSLCDEATLYIWDEPLNYVDIITREQIKGMLKESSAAMLFVEHDADFCSLIATKEITVNFS